MIPRPKLGYVDLYYGSRFGRITIGFDYQWPIRRADIKRIPAKKLEVYRKEAELYWAAILDLLYCFSEGNKVKPLLLGKTRCSHEISENSSQITVERSIEIGMKYSGTWDEIGCYIPFETVFEEGRSFYAGCLDLSVILFDSRKITPSRVASSRRKLQKLKSRLEIAVGRIAGIYLEDAVVNLALLDPDWEDHVSPDGFSGFRFLGMVLDQSEIAGPTVDNIVHNNVILLVKRMDDALSREDFASVLHASASIFETMAKDVIGIPAVQNQTLKSFFDRYRRDSRLPPTILDYILQIYDSRNTTPLAGHGSTQNPIISREMAVTLCEITKAIVRAEYRLHRFAPRITP